MIAHDWTATREQMILDPTIINLNTGSFGPLPKPVFERVNRTASLAGRGADAFLRPPGWPAALAGAANDWPRFSARRRNDWFSRPMFPPRSTSSPRA